MRCQPDTHLTARATPRTVHTRHPARYPQPLSVGFVSDVTKGPNVDHLAVLVDRSKDVAPDAGAADVGLVDEPPATGHTSGGGDQLRGEALDPPVDRDVVDGDAAFGEEFFDVAVGEPEAADTSGPRAR